MKKEATVVSKAADGAKTAAALGPWLVTNREAGESRPKGIVLTSSRAAQD